jgi:hypothetical protein
VTGGWTGTETCCIGGEAGSSVDLITQISSPIGICKIFLKFVVIRLSENDGFFVSNSPLLRVMVIFGCIVAVFLALAFETLG